MTDTANRRPCKADTTAADRLLRAGVRRAVADLRTGSTATDVAPTLLIAGNAAALLLDDRTATA